MLTEEEAELRKIYWYVHEKFINLKSERFFQKGDGCLLEDDIVGYDEMVGHLAQQVQQYCWDEGLTVDDLGFIEEGWWNSWLDDYALPEQTCSCDRGCKSCLGTEW